MWIALSVSIGLLTPILLGVISYRLDRNLHIVLSPREWVANTKLPAALQTPYLLGEKLVDFVPRMQQYTKTAEIVITLSSASIIFIPSHVTKQPAIAASMALLGFAVVWGVSFITWMSYCYEQNLYDPANFGAKQSSVMFALGFGALFCFAVAYVWLALVVAHVLAHGGPLS